MGFWRRPKRVNLALQGGGAHGAFTWGVLDRLLEEPGLAFGAVSATSAGAVNAAAMASGLAIGGPEAARVTLRKVWEAVQKAGVPDLLRLNPFFSGLSRAASLSNVGAMLSPYQFNPLGFDPLRKVLAAAVDFERIRRDCPVELLIAATDVATGRARLFRRRELTVEAVLASACLPTLHHTVEIEGRAYWDGGFSANPDLVTLAAESPVADTLLVLLNPLEIRGDPKSAREIAGHMSQITFGQPLLRDVEMIAAARETAPGWLAGRRTRLGRLARHRFHLIEAGRYTAPLGHESKMKPDGELLSYLFAAGRTEAQKWLERHWPQVGRRETADLPRHLRPPPASAATSAPALAATSRKAAG